MLDLDLRSGAVLTFGLAVAVAAALAIAKVIHGVVLRARGMRRAEYLGAVGEIISRGMKPDRYLEGWAKDDLFLEVIAEYLEVASGKELEHLMWLVEHLDVRNALARKFGGWSGRRPGKRRRRIQPPRWLPDPRGMRRLDAITKLAAIPHRSVEPVFIEGLRDRQPEIRSEAARGIAGIKDASAIPLLLDAIQGETPAVAYRIADQLAGIGSSGIEAIVTGLQAIINDPNAHLVVRTLGLIGDMRATPALVEFMVHEDPEIRTAAATAIGRAGSPDGLTALHAGLSDVDDGVRARSAAALSHFSSTRSIPHLEQALTDPAFWVRQNAAESLAEIPGGTNALRRATLGPDPFAADAALLQLGLKGQLEGDKLVDDLSGR